MLTTYFLGETLQARGIGKIFLKGWKGKRYNKDDFTKQGSHSDLVEKSKTKRIQHHQTSFTTNSLGMKPKRKGRTTKTSKNN